MAATPGANPSACILSSISSAGSRGVLPRTAPAVIATCPSVPGSGFHRLPSRSFLPRRMYSSWSPTRLRRAVMISDNAAWFGRPHSAAGSQAPGQGLQDQTPCGGRWSGARYEVAPAGGSPGNQTAAG